MRIKVADDNDLRTARAGLVICRDFFDGLAPDGQQAPANDGVEHLSGDILSQKETLELVRAYYRLSERPRRRFFLFPEPTGD